MGRTSCLPGPPRKINGVVFRKEGREEGSESGWAASGFLSAAVAKLAPLIGSRKKLWKEPFAAIQSAFVEQEETLSLADWLLAFPARGLKSVPLQSCCASGHCIISLGGTMIQYINFAVREVLVMSTFSSSRSHFNVAPQDARARFQSSTECLILCLGSQKCEVKFVTLGA